MEAIDLTKQYTIRILKGCAVMKSGSCFNCYGHGYLPLTFQSLAVTVRTTRFNIKKFYMVLALR